MFKSAPSTAPVGRYRWTICALLFFATTINYMDRSVLGVLGPTLQYKVFQWSDQDYANINIAFKAAYAIGLLTMGMVVDRLGTKIGYTISIAIWSVFGMLHALVQPAFSVVGFCLARFGLGLGEAGNFPSAIKAVAEWFPKKERALATGIFNAGSNVGAILAPTVIPLVVAPDGTNWQWAFLTTGFFSAIWVIVWLKVYRRPEDHPKLSTAELAYIQSDSVPETNKHERVPWSRVIRVRETWAFAAAKVTDAAWWFYLFWGGKFLYDRFGLDIKSLALPLIIIYVVADIGSIAGGWLSSAFIKRGWAVNRARKTTLLLCAICILPVMFVTQIGTRFNTDENFYARLQGESYSYTVVNTVNGKAVKQKVTEKVSAEDAAALKAIAGQSHGSAKEFLASARTALGKGDVETGKTKVTRMEQSLIRSARSDRMYWLAVWLIAIAAAAHQAWSANVFTLVSDVFPKRATASVTGIGGMVGAASGLIADQSLATALTASGPAGYFFAFLAAGSVYLVVLGIAHLLMPKMTPLDDNLRRVDGS
jgi:ACS family hexuronate transporter-like MFS transporter